MEKYVFITGGELFNKGAQSMSFIVVDEIKKRYPNTKVVLLSTPDFERSEEDKAQYNFEIMPFTSGWVYDLVGGGISKAWDLKNMIKGKSSDKYAKYKDILDERLDHTLAIIDVSGYALSSQFRSERSINLLLRILLAKKRKIKMVIMPQSFGPFDFEGKSKFIINYLMKSTLSYPEKIYAREQEGYELLKNKFNLTNVEKSYDMVLLNKELNLNNVFTEVPDIKTFDNVKGIGIVPNKENVKHGNKDEVLKLYQLMIEKLLTAGKTVYIARHSFDDLEACNTVKSLFPDNDNVKLIDEEISAIAFDHLVEKFDFVIGSRFHSIVHSYKNAVPCIALGWATKYRELLAEFDQNEYIFDVREKINPDNVEVALDKMLDNYEHESDKIKMKLNKIQSKNPFDIF